MFRINRFGSNKSVSYGLQKAHFGFRNQTGNKNFAKHQLTNYLSDVSNFRFQHLKKTDQINALSNLRDQRYIAKRTEQIGNLNNLRNTNNGNEFLKNKDILPKPRQYKDLKEKETKTVTNPQEIANILNAVTNNEPVESVTQLKKNNDPLLTKPTKEVSSQEELIKLLHQIDTNQQQNKVQQQTQQKKIQTNQPSPQQKKDTSVSENKQQTQELQYVISSSELINKTPFIIQIVQRDYFPNPNYNFYKLIQFIYMMYEKYASNPSVLMIIAKGISQANKKQMIKLPQDKIGDIVQYIISQIKL